MVDATYTIFTSEKKLGYEHFHQENDEKRHRHWDKLIEDLA
jgi:hypothetical protein